MTSINGKSFGKYKILSEIGKGGMGEVYLAQDTKLDRRVAIKFLSDEFGKDVDKLNRFIQEAKATSALNHPNILTVYEIDEFDDNHYIATEFIEGVTLRDTIGSKESVPLNQILKIGIQTAEALSAAHNAGIAHRDIKPENIMIRADGYVKVLDFGLAKLTEKSKPKDASLESETKVLVQTNPGVVMGTVSYMSPEQAQGKETDERTDIWSLGVVLYEMLAGKVPFEGKTLNHTIVAILETEPKLLENVPNALQRIVRKALTKEKRMRYQTALDLLIDLKNLKDELKMQGEIERSIIPNKEMGAIAGNETAVYTNESNEETTASGQVPVTQNVTTTSSLEYAVGRAKSNKLVSAILGLILVGLISAGGYFAFFARSESKAIQSIAVMPFINESNDKEVEYLSDGMTESLISSLSKIPEVSVKARSTIFFYKGKEVSPKKLGEELNVQAVLLGRVVKRGDDLKLSLELVDTRTQNVVWSDNYNRRMDNLLSLQAEMTNSVFNELKLELSDVPDPELVRGHTTNSGAYKEYLRGRFNWNKRTGPDIEKSIGFFQKAIEFDPNYANAWNALADSYILMPEYSQQPSKGFVAKAKSAAMKALEINPDLAEAHATLAYSFATYERKFVEAERKYKKAIELDPGYATVHQWYGELLSNLERHDEAIKEIDVAQELEPRSFIINIVKTTLLLNAERPDESIALSNKILNDAPGVTICYIHLITAYRQKGNKDRFIETAIKLNKIQGKDKKFIQGLKTAFENGGFAGYYRFRVKSFSGKSSPRWAAKFYLLAGDKEKAIKYLNDGFEKQEKSMLTIKADPDFDVLHDDPRFLELVKKLGFSK